MGRNKTYGFAICEEFDLSYFPDVTDDKALLALVLMREADREIPEHAREVGVQVQLSKFQLRRLR